MYHNAGQGNGCDAPSEARDIVSTVVPSRAGSENVLDSADASPKRFGWGVLVYAVSVSLATIYGRYHYAADVLAGFGISLIAGAVCWRLRFAADRHSA